MHLSDLLTPETIQLGVIADNWQDVVERAGSKLLEADAIEATFIQAMKQTILEHGPYMVIWPGVVLLHAPPQGVQTSLHAVHKPEKAGLLWTSGK